MDFETIARSAIQQKSQVKNLPAAVVDELARDYATRIENVITRQILQQLEGMGQLDAYEAILDDPAGDAEEFLLRAIPDWNHVRVSITQAAVQEVTGVSLPLSSMP